MTNPLVVFSLDLIFSFWNGFWIDTELNRHSHLLLVVRYTNLAHEELSEFFLSKGDTTLSRSDVV